MNMYFKTFAAIALFVVSGGANAVLILDTSDATRFSDSLQVANSVGDINTIFGTTYTDPGVDKFEFDAAGGTDGDFSFTGVMENGGADGWTGGTLSNNGGEVDCPLCLLVVKDGNHSPAQYLFDLTVLGWDGIEDIQLTGFWMGDPGFDAGGEISNVRFFGEGSTTDVPEPTALALFASGILGFGFTLRRRNKAVSK